MRKSSGFAPILIVIAVTVIALVGIVIINPFDDDRSGAPAFIKKIVEENNNGAERTDARIKLSEVPDRIS